MAAKSTQLELLHEALAVVIKQQVSATAEWVNEAGEMQKEFTASPALLAVAAKFLKDNDISCSIEDDENLGELAELLANKQKKGRLALVDASPKQEATQ